jgi:WD40 repeat protein
MGTVSIASLLIGSLLIHPASGQTIVQQALPDESQWPGARTPLVDPPVDRRAADAVENLPAESVVASAGVRPARGGNNDAEATSDVAGRNIPDVTPDESQLAVIRRDDPPRRPAIDQPNETKEPGAAQETDETVEPTDPQGADPPQGARAQPDDSDVSPGEQRPWLRLRYDGHTETVRTLDVSSDGQWMISAGEDKVLHVWQRNDDQGWIHRRSIRWQIQRGPRGRIYAAALRGKIAAIAGHGAMGGLGEIWLVDITTGVLIRPLVEDDGHRQTIASLVWAPGETPRLASADVQGRIMVWSPDPQTGLWPGKVVIDRDEKRYGSPVAKSLEPVRGYLPVAFIAPDTLVFPQLSNPDAMPAGPPIWKLNQINLTTNATREVPRSDHLQAVIAIASTGDGRRLASTDMTGRLRIWRDPFAAGGPGPISDYSGKQVGSLALRLAFNQDGTRLMLGALGTTAASGDLQIWKVTDAAGTTGRTAKLATAAPVIACDWAAEDREVIFAASSDLNVNRLDAAGKIVPSSSVRLSTAIRPVRRVAFRKQSDTYQIGIGYGEDFQQLFDLQNVQLGRAANLDPDDFIDPQTDQAKWSWRSEQTADGLRFRLYLGDDPRALLPLRMETHGTPTTICVIDRPADGSNLDVADAAEQLIVVGTSSRSNIYCYQTPPVRTDDPPRLVRQFRGHSGSVTSLGHSSDGRYLASGSIDATVGIWALADIFTVGRTENLWGANFEANDNGLTIVSIREDGPLFFRGLRQGDRVVSLRWQDSANDPPVVATTGRAMLDALEQPLFDRLMVFECTRRDQPLPHFQSFAAWHPIANLFIDRDREWAFWTPAGIYDASLNGSRHFGWQINRGIDQLPEFFLADQFKARLERPDVMRRLLDRGSLAESLAKAGGAGVPPAEGAIANQIRNRPRIEITQPAADQWIEGDTLYVEAKIQVPFGASLEAIKVFADGLPASTGQLKSVENEGEFRVEHHSWQVPLVHDSEITLEVLAATEARAVDRATRIVHRRLASPRPARMPRIHVIAVGVGDYNDPQIQSLDFAAQNAKRVHDQLATSTTQLYRFTGTTLVDNDAIRPLWNVYTEEAANRLAEDIGPDDLVVMYLSGHGLRDRRTNRWYFVTSDAHYNDLMSDRYEDCLSFEDLSTLAKLPCRKLAILDSCHSGAVQPVMEPHDLKAALRWLQDDMVLTLTASEGNEEAAEQREARLGRFTARLIDALRGQADSSGDGIVTLDETFRYVTDAMEADSLRDGFIQRPTAGPADLLKAVSIPLATTAAP